MGEKGYMVTFRMVDPLFAVDLSDPANPKILGELKIPGFSDYLHPYDENHIIGFGRDADMDGFETGMKMALFDVTDPTNPKELYATKIGDRGTFSEILHNHRALLFSKEKDIIAFPVAFQGAIIYGLDLERGFSLKGKITHIDEVDRIIYIGDVLYTTSKGMIKASDMNSLREIKSVAL